MRGVTSFLKPGAVAHQANVPALISLAEGSFLGKASVARRIGALRPKALATFINNFLLIGFQFPRRADARYSIIKKGLQFCQLGTAEEPVGLI